MHAEKDPHQPAQEDSTTDQAYRGGGDIISRGGADIISKGGGDIISKDANSQPPGPEPETDAQNAASVRTLY